MSLRANCILSNHIQNYSPTPLQLLPLLTSVHFIPICDRSLESQPEGIRSLEFMEMSGAAASLNRAPSMMIKTQSSLGAGNRHVFGSRICIKPRREFGIGFRDVGHVLYYQTTSTRMRREKEMTLMMASCGGVATEKKMKKDEKKKMKKLKLLKGLTKDLSMLSQAGLVGEDNGDGISGAAETLLKHLQEMKSREKELKKKRKMEKGLMKAAKPMDSESSCSSKSSDSECGEVMNLASLRMRSSTQSEAPKVDSKVDDSGLPLPTIGADLTQANGAEDLSLSNPVITAETQTKKIEVCMGGKCKKSGAAQLVEEFEKVVGEGVVVGCKCMGKCRDGPNVRVLSSCSGDASDLGKIEASSSPPPLCIGVGLEDVGVIVANFFGAGSCSGQASLAVAAA